MFETLFLNQFEPDGEGYRYRSFWHGMVHFSIEEVDHFVAFRRALWSSPLLWAVILLVGVAAPLAMAFSGIRNADNYAALLVLAGISVPGLLISWAQTDPEAAAAAKPPTGPTPWFRGYGHLMLRTGIALAYFLVAIRMPDSAARIIWNGVGVIWIVQTILLLRGRRPRGGVLS